MNTRITKTVKLDEADVEYVEKVAAERGVTFTDIIRELIQDARGRGFEPRRKSVNWLKP